MLPGWARRFDIIVCGDEIKNGKPAPDIFLEVSRGLNIQPERCVVLEDSDPGIRAAHAAGMIPIMVPDLRPPSPDTALLAHKIFPSLLEARRFLANPSGRAF